MTTIIVDAGHGWKKQGEKLVYDSGAIGRLDDKTYEEHKIAVRYAETLAGALRLRAPYLKVETLIATQDKPLSLNQRRALKPDALFVSIHLNAHTTSQARGFEVFYHNPLHLPFATALYNAGLRALPTTPRGIKQANFTVIRRSAPACLVELGFITNPDDLRMLLLDTTRQQWATATALAIIQTIGGKS